MSEYRREEEDDEQEQQSSRRMERKNYGVEDVLSSQSENAFFGQLTQVPSLRYLTNHQPTSILLSSSIMHRISQMYKHSIYQSINKSPIYTSKRRETPSPYTFFTFLLLPCFTYPFFHLSKITHLPKPHTGITCRNYTHPTHSIKSHTPTLSCSKKKQ